MIVFRLKQLIFSHIFCRFIVTLLLSAVILVGYDDILKSYSLFNEGVIRNLVKSQ